MRRAVVSTIYLLRLGTWNCAEIPKNSDLPWQEASLGETGGRADSEILRPYSHGPEFLHRMTPLEPPRIGKMPVERRRVVVTKGACVDLSREKEEVAEDIARFTSMIFSFFARAHQISKIS